MQIIHKSGFNPDQLNTYKPLLLSNIIVALKAIANTLQNNKNSLFKKCQWLEGVDPEVEWNESLVERVQDLWNDERMKEAWEDVREITMIQLDYLMGNLDRFLSQDFQPTNDDILRARICTTGDHSSQFDTSFENKNLMWNLVDVGGQFSEREKWKSILDSPEEINGCLFFLALDEFNIPNLELKTSEYNTKFDLAFAVFEEIMNSVENVCRILFLNKVDLFQKKLEDKEKFTQFKKNLGYDGDNSRENCTKFLQNQLTDKLNNKDHFYVHVTNTLDTELIRKVTDTIMETIISSTTKDSGNL